MFSQKSPINAKPYNRTQISSLTPNTTALNYLYLHSLEHLTSSSRSLLFFMYIIASPLVITLDLDLISPQYMC